MGDMLMARPKSVQCGLIAAPLQMVIWPRAHKQGFVTALDERTWGGGEEASESYLGEKEMSCEILFIISKTIEKKLWSFLLYENYLIKKDTEMSSYLREVILRTNSRQYNEVTTLLE